MKLQITLLIALSSLSGLGQNLSLPLRFSFEYTPTMDVVGAYKGFQVWQEAPYELVTEPVEDNFYESYNSFFKTENDHSLSHNFALNIKITRKISIEIPFGFNKYKFRFADQLWDDFYSTNYYNLYDFTMKKRSVGFGINFHTKGGYTLVSNSFGLFYKRNSVTTSNYNDYYAFLRRIPVDFYETNEQISYLTHVIGVKFNYISMISDKLPLYVKYGFSAGIPIVANIIDRNASLEPLLDYSEIENVNLDDANIFTRFKESEYFNIFIGLGIVI